MTDGDAGRRQVRRWRASQAVRAALLTGERTALNFLGRLSGIATLAARCVAAVRGTARNYRRYAQDDARAARCWRSTRFVWAARTITAPGSTTAS